MSRPSTGIDVQRATFVESLHNSLRKQATVALEEHKKFVTIARSYLEDGLDEKECAELLMIDGLSREASESYAAMATSKESDSPDELSEYSFQFEDVTGKIYSSFDIGRTVKASTDDDAWTLAEELLDTESEVELQRLLSVHRID